MLSQEQIDTLRLDLRVAEEKVRELKQGEEGSGVIFGYWIGRLESLRSVNSLIGFTEGSDD